MKTIISKQNDTIDLICLAHYGITADVTELVLNANPHLMQLSSPILPIGLQIQLPDYEAQPAETINLWR